MTPLRLADYRDVQEAERRSRDEALGRFLAEEVRKQRRDELFGYAIVSVVSIAAFIAGVLL